MKASARTAGWSRARAPRAASRCSPTTRTSGSRAPPVWYFAHAHAPGLERRSARRCPACRLILRAQRAHRLGLHQHRRRTCRTSTREAAPRRPLSARRGPRAFQRHRGIDPRAGRASASSCAVRVSRHGPVISDVLARRRSTRAPRGYVHRARLDRARRGRPARMQAALAFARAREWRRFRSPRVRDFHAPQQNVAYADVDGNIGFIAAGARAAAQAGERPEGLAPAPGWDARYDWVAQSAYGAAARVFNPPSGAVVSANHKISLPPGYRAFITSEWQAPYRAGRDRRAARGDAESTRAGARMRADTSSSRRRDARAAAARSSRRPRRRHRRARAREAAAWDGTMSRSGRRRSSSSRGGASRRARSTRTELGPAFTANWSTRAQFISKRARRRTIGQALVATTVRTEKVEDCPEILAESLDARSPTLRGATARTRTRWRWGDAHAAWHRHRRVSRVPLARALVRHHSHAVAGRCVHAERGHAVTSPTNPTPTPAGTPRACAPFTTWAIRRRRSSSIRRASRATRCRPTTATSRRAGRAANSYVPMLTGAPAGIRGARRSAPSKCQTTHAQVARPLSSRSARRRILPISLVFGRSARNPRRTSAACSR